MTKKEDIIIMNFSGIYKQQQFWQTGEIQRNISWVEVQELPGKQLLLRWRCNRELCGESRRNLMQMGSISLIPAIIII